MEGYDVMPMREAASEADVIVTTTGNRDVVTREDFEVMPDGVLLANAGHFDVEVNLDQLSDLAVETREVRDGVREYQLEDGRRLNVLAEGRLVNLGEDGRRLNVLAEGRLVNLAGPISLGHPVEVMDQSFGVQAVAVRELVEHGDEYGPGVHDVPDRLDREVAEIKLAAEGVEIDDLTDVQAEYMDSWQHGT
jgi:adenosylhomocysteinase